jgi:hypothetical protein
MNLVPDPHLVERAARLLLEGHEDWVLRSFSFAEGAKRKIGRTLGRSLGWGLGVSQGVKLALPDRQVVALLGDGAFLPHRICPSGRTDFTSARSVNTVASNRVVSATPGSSRIAVPRAAARSSDGKSHAGSSATR